jgi:rhamnulokinase
MGTAFLAVDLGAESGRAVLGRFDGERITLEEVHRFQNMPVRLPDGLHWYVLRIAREVKDGITKATRNGGRIESLEVDAWGVDLRPADGRHAGEGF